MEYRMKIRAFFALGFLCIVPLSNAQDQFYSTVDLTANVLEMAHDKQLLSNFNGSGVIVVAGVQSRTPYVAWTNSVPVIWVKLNKTVSCAGQDVENFIVLPMIIQATPQGHGSLPWFASAGFDDYPFVKNELFTAYANNLQLKISKVVCGVSQVHPVKKTLVPVAYIPGVEYFTVIPGSSNGVANNSAWINGVQVTPTNTQPTNAVVTNWNFTIPTTGNYDVYVHWVSNKNQVSNISYAVNGQPLKSATLDQNINAGIWTKLIKNTQYPVGEQSIKISVDANANYVVDGVRAEKSAQ